MTLAGWWALCVNDGACGTAMGRLQASGGNHNPLDQVEQSVAFAAGVGDACDSAILYTPVNDPGAVIQIVARNDAGKMNGKMSIDLVFPAQRWWRGSLAIKAHW